MGHGFHSYVTNDQRPPRVRSSGASSRWTTPSSGSRPPGTKLQGKCGCFMIFIHVNTCYYVLMWFKKCVLIKTFDGTVIFLPLISNRFLMERSRFFFQFWYGVSNNHLDDPLNFLDHGDFWEKLPHWLPCCYSNPLEIPSQGTLSRFTSLATMGLVVDHSKSSTNSWFSMVGLLKELRASHLKQGQEEQGLTASKTKTPLDTKKN